MKSPPSIALRLQHRPMGPRTQRGFLLLELIVVMMIVGVSAIYANQASRQASEESLAQGAGSYLSITAAALDRHIALNFDQISQGLPVAGTAIALQPTLAEMIALGRLRAGFPAVTPTRQQIQFNIVPVGCPGAGCQIIGTSCTTTPITLGFPNVRYDLATIMLEQQGGNGGYARYGDGANIRGPVLNTPNPFGNVQGIVCGSSFMDVAMWQRFVRINDNRDPNLQGNLTVAGNTTLNGPTTINNNLTVANGATVGPCINLSGGAQGRAAFGCANPNDVPAGYTGGVRSADIVANGNILASDAPGAFVGANGNYALVTSNNGAGVAEIRTSGRAAGDRLTPLGSYALGAACAVGDEGSIARVAAGSGLATCNNGAWRALSLGASAGDACATEGAVATSAANVQLLCVNGTYRLMSDIIRFGTPGGACPAAGVTAIDTANSNSQLVCRFNLAGGVLKWMRLQDITSHVVHVSANEVGNDAVVPKPFCNDTAATPATPQIQLIGKVTSTNDGGTAIYAVDNGASWTVRLHNGAGGQLTGVPNAAVIAQVYCYFP